jgi:hypothetical protein
MNKQAFLLALQKELNEKRVSDPGDILQEYEQHFAYKLADGYTEEEIAAKLGSPREIAAQYEEGAAPEAPRGGQRAILRTGLCFADLFAAILWFALALTVLVIGVFALAARQPAYASCSVSTSPPSCPPCPISGAAAGDRHALPCRPHFCRDDHKLALPFILDEAIPHMAQESAFRRRRQHPAASFPARSASAGRGGGRFAPPPYSP